MASITKSQINNQTDRHGFEWFWITTSESLGPALGWRGWGQTVLQLSEQDATVRHAMLGLGSLHKHHLRTRGLHLYSKVELLHSSYIHYGKAISLLRHKVQEVSNVCPIATMLVCTLFAVFDFLNGDDQAAAAHLEAGITVLRGFVGNATQLSEAASTNSGQVSQGPALTRNHLSDIQIGLISTFSSLDFFSLWWSNGEVLFPEATPLDSIASVTNVAGNNCMSSVLRQYFGIERRIHQFLKCARARRWSSANVNPADSFEATRTALLSELSCSLLSFHSIHNAESDHENRKGQSVLGMNYDILRIMLHASTEDARSDYRPFDKDFESVVTKASALALDIEPSKCPFQSFSFSHGLIYPLYIAATCCTDTLVCQTAITSLTSFRWSEGVWNGQSMAKIAERKLAERASTHSHRIRAAPPRW